MTDLNYGAIADCIDGKHGPLTTAGRCVYCDEPLAEPVAPTTPPATMPVIEIPTVEMAVSAQNLRPDMIGGDLRRPNVLPDDRARPHTVVIGFVDGPLHGQTRGAVPADATIIKEIWLFRNSEPYAGTFYDPFRAVELYYRIDDDGDAYFMYTS